MTVMFKLKVRGTKIGGKDFFGRWTSQTTIITKCRGENTDGVSLGGSHDRDGVEYIRAYSINKVRRKFVRFEKPKKWSKKMLTQAGFSTADEKFTHGEQVYPTHWVGVYYDFPAIVLKMMNLKVVQGKHSYKLVRTK